MADKTIPDLAELTTIDDNTLFLADSGTQSFKVKGSTVRKFIGVQVYNSGVTYLANDLVASAGLIYKSLAGSNVGNALTDATKWVLFGGYSPAIKTTTATVVIADDIIRLDTTSGAFTTTLPTIASSYGKKFVFKWIDNGSANIPTLKGNGSELIEAANTFLMGGPGDALTLWNNGTNWEII